MKTNLTKITQEIGIYFVAVMMVTTQSIPVGLALPTDAPKEAEDFIATQTVNDAAAEVEAVQYEDSQNSSDLSLNFLEGNALELIRANEKMGDALTIAQTQWRYSCKDAENAGRDGWYYNDKGRLVNSKSSNWFVDRGLVSDIHDLGSGEYEGSLSGKNFSQNGLAQDYESFIVDVYGIYADGSRKKLSVVNLAASDADDQEAFYTFTVNLGEILTKMEYHWRNDDYQAGSHDANFSPKDMTIRRTNEFWSIAVEDEEKIFEAVRASNLEEGWYVHEDGSVSRTRANASLDISFSAVHSGLHKISLTVKNRGRLQWKGAEADYDAFKVKVRIGDKVVDLEIPASDDEWITVFAEVDLAATQHEAQIEWENDYWMPGMFDANIQIKDMKVQPMSAIKPLPPAYLSDEELMRDFFGQHITDIEIYTKETFLCADGTTPQSSFCDDAIFASYIEPEDGERQYVQFTARRYGDPTLDHLRDKRDAETDLALQAAFYHEIEEHLNRDLDYKDVTIIFQKSAGPRDRVHGESFLGPTVTDYYVLGAEFRDCPAGNQVSCQVGQYFGPMMRASYSHDTIHPGVGHFVYDGFILEGADMNNPVEHVTLLAAEEPVGTNKVVILNADGTGAVLTPSVTRRDTPVEGEQITNENIAYYEKFRNSIEFNTCMPEGCSRVGIHPGPGEVLIGLLEQPTEINESGVWKEWRQHFVFGIPKNLVNSIAFPALVLLEKYRYSPWAEFMLDVGGYQKMTFAVDDMLKEFNITSEGMSAVLITSKDPGVLPSVVLPNATSADVAICNDTSLAHVVDCFNFDVIPGSLADTVGPKLHRLTSLDRNNDPPLQVVADGMQYVMLDQYHGGLAGGPPHQLHEGFPAKDMTSEQRATIEKIIQKDRSEKATWIDLENRLGTKYTVTQAYEAKDVLALRRSFDEKAREAVQVWQIGFNYLPDQPSNGPFPSVNIGNDADAVYLVYVYDEPFPDGRIELVLLSEIEDPNAKWEAYADRILEVLNKLTLGYKDMNLPQDPVEWDVLHRAEKLFQASISAIENIVREATEDLGDAADQENIAIFEQKLDRALDHLGKMLRETKFADTYFINKSLPTDREFQLNLDMKGMRWALNEAIREALNGGILIEGLSPEGYAALLPGIDLEDVEDLMNFHEMTDAMSLDYCLFSELTGKDCYYVENSLGQALAETDRLLVRLVQRYNKNVIEVEDGGDEYVNLRKFKAMLQGHNPNPPTSNFEALMDVHGHPAKLVTFEEGSLCVDSTDPNNSYCADVVTYYYQRESLNSDGTRVLGPRIWRTATIRWGNYEVLNVREASVYSIAQYLIAEATQAVLNNVTILGLRELDNPHNVEARKQYSVKYQIRQECPENTECVVGLINGLALISQGSVDLDLGPNAEGILKAYYPYAPAELLVMKRQVAEMVTQMMIEFAQAAFGHPFEGWWPGAFVGGKDKDGKDQNGVFSGIDMEDFVDVACVVAEEGNSCHYVMGSAGFVVPQYAKPRQFISSMDGTISDQGFMDLVWNLLFRYGFALETERDAKTFIYMIL